MASEEESEETQSLDDLFNAEEEFMPSPIYSKIKLFLSFREYALFFIELNSKQENFDALVPYLAMTYVDRFTSTRNIPKVDRQSTSRNTHLFLICCLTIASKMRVDDFKIAGFLSIRETNKPYTGDEAFHMEWAISQGLKWKLQTITPFCFVDFFINLLHCCSDVHPMILRRSVHRLLIKSLAIGELLKYRPSRVAASAVITVACRLYPHKMEQVLPLIYSAARVTLNPPDPLFEVGEHLVMIYRRLCAPDPVPPVAATQVPPEEARLRDVVPMRWNLIGPMNFKLDWAALALEMLDLENDINATRAAEYYFSFFTR